MGGAPGGTYQGMSFTGDPFSRADADRVFREQFGDKNPFEIMQELSAMMNAFSQLSLVIFFPFSDMDRKQYIVYVAKNLKRSQKDMDENFGSRYRMPDMGNLKGPKFGDNQLKID